jgi:hypothetical protein
LVSTRTIYQVPRVSAMISSVFIRTVALPRNRANALSGALARGLAGLSTTSPLGSRSNVTALPALRPRWSRTAFGTVTWPLLVMVVI